MAPPLTQEQVVALVGKFDRERDRFEKLALAVQRRLQEAMRSNQIRCIVTSRRKDGTSLAKKLADNSATLDYELLTNEFTPHILDLAGARVMLYEFDRDHEQAVKLAEDIFDVLPGERYRRDHGLAETRVYQARHRVVALRGQQLENPELGNLRGVVCEIQIVGLVKHIWNELEHDVKYKDKEQLGPPSAEQTAWLSVLWDALQAGQTAVAHLSRATDERRAQQLDLRARLATPADVRLALERLWSRPIKGDVERLFQLLDRSEREVTKYVLAYELELANPSKLTPARERAAAAGFLDLDDVEAIVASLTATRGQDFLEAAANWNSLGRLKQIIEGLSKKPSK